MDWYVACRGSDFANDLEGLSICACAGTGIICASIAYINCFSHQQFDPFYLSLHGYIHAHVMSQKKLIFQCHWMR